MPWVKFDDTFATHPKIERVGHAAAWLYVASLCYCAQHLTDGHIPKVKVPRLTDIPTPTRHAKRLVDAGLWDDVGDDYVIHDYLEYQPAREKVLADRQADLERKRRGRMSEKRPAGQKAESGRNPSAVRQESGQVSGDCPAVPTRPVPNPSPTPPHDDDPPPPNHHPETTTQIEHILRIALNTEHTNAEQRGTPIRNRTAWETTLTNDWNDRLNELTTMLQTYTWDTDEHLSDWLRGDPGWLPKPMPQEHPE